MMQAKRFVVQEFLFGAGVRRPNQRGKCTNKKLASARSRTYRKHRHGAPQDASGPLQAVVR